jgi:hypothetical protein
VKWKRQHGIIQKRHYYFLGNNKAKKKTCDMVADLVESHKAMGCNMSLKVHFLDSQD